MREEYVPWLHQEIRTKPKPIAAFSDSANVPIKSAQHKGCAKRRSTPRSKAADILNRPEKKSYAVWLVLVLAVVARFLRKRRQEDRHLARPVDLTARRLCLPAVASLLEVGWHTLIGTEEQ